MKFLFISLEGDTTGLAKIIADEGNDVKVWIKDPKYKNTFDGIVKKVDDWKKAVDKDTTIIVDQVKMSNIGQNLIDNGYHVVGGSKFADRIELDREFGSKIMQDCGLAVPPYQQFDNFDSALSFLKKAKAERYVFKPSGNIGIDWTYVASDNEDMIERMKEKFQPEWPAGKPVNFLLEEYCKGIECSTEGWFSNGNFVNMNSTMEEKKAFTGNLGPNTGCSGNLVWNYHNEPPLFKQTVGKLFEVLRKQNYIGAIDVNSIISESNGKPMALEFTARFGYDALQAWIQTVQIELGKMFYELARGKIKEIPTCNMFSGSVRVVHPPYPFDFAKDREGEPVVISDKALNGGHFYFSDVKMKDKKLILSGVDGILCMVCAKGNTIPAAMSKCYKLIEEIKKPTDIFYRTDIGERAEKDYKELKSIGLI